MSVKRRIGALVIGQSPRPDLVLLFSHLAPNVEIVEAGALDGVATDSLPPLIAGDHPLTTLLRDGRAVTVSEGVLTGLLQVALNRLESEQKVDATVLLCAGPFDSLVSTRPILKPFAMTLALLAALGIRRIGVVCPFPDQLATAVARWGQAGLNASTWVKPPDRSLEEWLPDQVSSTPDVEAVVLDFVGYTEESVMASRRNLEVPVLDPGRIATAVAGGVTFGSGPSSGDTQVDSVERGLESRGH